MMSVRSYKSHGRTMQILHDLRAELAREKGAWPAIARAGECSYNALIRIASGQQSNPRLNTIAAIQRGIEHVRRARAAGAPQGARDA